MGGWNAFSVFAAITLGVAINTDAQSLPEEHLPVTNTGLWLLMADAKPARSYNDWNRSLIGGADYRWLFRDPICLSGTQAGQPHSMLADPLPAWLALIRQHSGSSNWGWEKPTPSYLHPDIQKNYPGLIDPVVLQAINGVAEMLPIVERNPDGVWSHRINRRGWTRIETIIPGQPDKPLFRDAPQRSPSAFYLTDDVQYFPAAPLGLIQLASNEAELKPTKKSAATKPSVEVLPAAVTPSSPTATVAAAAPLSKQRRQRRAKWSAALQTPANLMVDAEATITLGELLERIQKQHGLPVRVDLAHVLPMTAMAEMTTVRRTPKKSQNGMVKAPSAMGLLPFGIMQVYSSEPSPPAYHPAAVPPVTSGSYAAPSAGPVTYAPDENVLPLPPPEPPFIPLRVNKLTGISDDEADAEDAPVSAIKAEVIEPSPSEDEKKPPAAKSDSQDDESDSQGSAHAIQEMLTQMMNAPVNPAIVNQSEATVEDILRQAFDRSFPLQALINASIGEEVPMLASFTKATEWDLLIQDDGILLTTRLNANLHKETRVYSTRELEKSASLKAEDVARVLTRTVRPWSWKRNFPEVMTAAKPTAESKRAAKTGKVLSVPKIDLSLLGLLFSSRSTLPRNVRLASDESSSPTITVDGSNSENVELTEEQLELLGRAWDTLFQGAVSSIQVIYHADPPTGVIEVLPGMLVISQSQGAHREIADLLEQLSQPEN